MRQASKCSTTIALLICATVGTSATAAAQSPRPNNLFTASGFTVRYADTPEKLAILRSLPPDKLVIKKHNGKILYVYSDPTICVCAYVGTPEAYAAFRNGGIDQQSNGGGNLRPNYEQQVIDSINEETDTGPVGTFSARESMFGDNY